METATPITKPYEAEISTSLGDELAGYRESALSGRLQPRKVILRIRF